MATLKSRSNTVAFAGLLIIAGGGWWSATYNLDLRIAIGGFSPLHYSAAQSCPECFAGDSDLGDMFSVSLLSRVYDAARLFSISAYNAQLGIIALETLLISLVTYWGALRCFRTSPGAAMFTTALVMTSTALHLNLGGWTAPIFSGLPYALAHATQVTGILLFVAQRPVAAAMLLALSFSLHPAIGGLGMLFVVGAALGHPVLLKRGSTYVAGALAAILMLAWMTFGFSSSALSAPYGVVTDAEWIAINRMLNFHFFPDELGLLGARADAILIPWLAAMGLITHYMRRAPGDGVRERMVLGGLMMAVVLTLIGVFASVSNADPRLIRLTLVRASEFAGTIGIFYVGCGLYRDITQANIVRAVLAIIIVVSFFSFPRYPVVPILLLLATDAPDWLRRHRTDALLIAESALFILLAITLFYCYSGEVLIRPVSWIAFGSRPFEREEWWAFWGAGLLLTAVVARLTPLLLAPRRGAITPADGDDPVFAWSSACLLPVALAVCIMGGHHVWTTRSFARPLPVLQWAADYRDAQLWARRETPPGTIFMPDPTIYYGWRDYSWRPSFGNMFEWLRQPLLYRVDEAAFLEGRKRFAEFEMDIETYKSMGPGMRGYAAINKDLKRAFYTKSEAWFEHAATTYNVSYVVMDLKYLDTALAFPEAFRNKSFVIYRINAAGGDS